MAFKKTPIFLILILFFTPGISQSLASETVTGRADTFTVSSGELVNTVPLPVLAELLKNENSGIRKYVAEILGNRGDTLAVPVLCNALDDSAAAVKKSAIKSLAKINGNDYVIPFLTKMLSASDSETRQVGADVLGDAGSSTVVPALLVAAMSDKSPEVRISAILSLGKIRDKSAMLNLIAVLSDENKEVKKSAIKALGSIGDTVAVSPLMNIFKEDKDYACRVEAAFALGSIGKPAIPSLMKLLQRGKKGLTAMAGLAALALGRTGETSVIPVLTDTLNDWSDYVRQNVATALRYFGKDAIAPLVKNLKDSKKDKNVRKYAAEALGRIGDTSVIPALAEALNDKDEEVKACAAEALSNFGRAGSESAAKKMMGEESDFERRFKNAVLLARFSNEASFVFLNDALNNEGYRQRAIRALEQYFKGEVKKIAAVKKILCPSCLGSRECSACKGAGTVGEAIMLPVTCQWCGGSGKCPTCNGEGRIQRMYYKYIYVPAAKGEVSVGMPQITPGE